MSAGRNAGPAAAVASCELRLRVEQYQASLKTEARAWWQLRAVLRLDLIPYNEFDLCCAVDLAAYHPKLHGHLKGLVCAQ